jgi:hypothetical protein
MLCTSYGFLYLVFLDHEDEPLMVVKVGVMCFVVIDKLIVRPPTFRVTITSVNGCFYLGY